MNPISKDSLIVIACLHIFIFLVLSTIALRAIYLIFFNGGANRKPRILSVGMAALFFPSTLHDAFIYPFVRLLQNLQNIYYGLIAPANTSGQSQEFQSSVSDIFSTFPLANLLMFVGLGVGIYWAIELARNRLHFSGGAVKGLSHILVYNIGILTLMLFSLFLVISVFISIPYLSEIGKPSIFTPVRLDSVLSSRSTHDTLKVTGPASNIPALFGNTVEAQLFAENDTKQAYSKLNVGDKGKAANEVSALQSQLDHMKSLRERAMSSIVRYGQAYKSWEDKLKQGLSLNFSIRSQSITTDKALLYQSSVNLFENAVQYEKDNFKRSVDNVADRDAINQDNFAANIASLSSHVNELLKSETSTTQDSIKGISPFFTVNYNLVPYTELSQDVDYDTSIPALSKDGSDWGFFGKMAKFLIRTQSVDLVLLIGMFGFGLLGAAILSFEKMDDFLESFATQPLIKNIGNVLARGFGAALVVYLSTKGGLAVFSPGSNNDPNGYILLLSCFIGAVFSDKIWTKASSLLK